MKAIARAIIIGNQTAGKVLTMEVILLPDGAFFINPNRQTITSKNEILEGVGVIPDIKVDLDIDALSNGSDTRLNQAMEHLSKHKE